MSRNQRITMNDAEYVEQLLLMAKGNRALVDEAISASADGLDGASDLKSARDIAHRDRFGLLLLDQNNQSPAARDAGVTRTAALSSKRRLLCIGVPR